MRLTLPIVAGMTLQAARNKASVPSSQQFTGNTLTARQPLTRDIVSFSKQPRFGAAMPPPGGGGSDPFRKWASQSEEDSFYPSTWNPYAGTHGEFLANPHLSQESSEPEKKKISSRTLYRRARKAREAGNTKEADRLSSLAKQADIDSGRTLGKRPDDKMSSAALYRRGKKAEKAGNTEEAERLRDMALQTNRRERAELAERSHRQKRSQPRSVVSESEQGGYSSTGLTDTLSNMHVSKNSQSKPINYNALLRHFQKTGSLDREFTAENHIALLGLMTVQAQTENVKNDPAKRERALRYIKGYSTAYDKTFPNVTHRNQALAESMTVAEPSSAQQQPTVEQTLHKTDEYGSYTVYRMSNGEVRYSRP